MEVHGRDLTMPFSHNLPLMIAGKPLYDSVLGRLSNYLRSQNGHLSLIDIGANIGDTAIACNLKTGDSVVCVEPNEQYWPYLVENTKQLPCETYLIKSFIGNQSDQIQVDLCSSHGTGRYIKSQEGNFIKTRNILSIQEEVNLKSCNLLKIDTDGYDFECISGGKSFFNKFKPAVLFESDVFSNSEYVQQFSSSLSTLREVGYSCFILYSNDGYLFSFINQDNELEVFKALFYQVTSSKIYFDVLALTDSNFLKNELSYFSNLPNDSIKEEVSRALADCFLRYI
jgi:FkbM family methyltransferase